MWEYNRSKLAAHIPTAMLVSQPDRGLRSLLLLLALLCLLLPALLLLLLRVCWVAGASNAVSCCRAAARLGSSCAADSSLAASTAMLTSAGRGVGTRPQTPMTLRIAERTDAFTLCPLSP
jgi:hypothetical protein